MKLRTSQLKIDNTAVGFLSEHTAEFIIAPNICSILDGLFGSVIPFFFWSQREGSKMSEEIGRHREVMVVAIFPRRPKVKNPNQQTVLVKFNEALFRYAANAASMGIPTFAAVPLVSSLFDLSHKTRVGWFCLKGSNSTVKDIFVHLSTQTESFTVEKSEKELIGPLQPAEILKIIEKSAKPMLWPSVIEKLRLLRKATQSNNSREYRFLPWLVGYKPFFVMIEPSRSNKMNPKSLEKNFVGFRTTN